jgi:hypothetical protein
LGDARVTYVVIVLLHGNYPRNVVESNGTETEVSIVRNLANLLDEAIEIRGWDTVDSGDEVGGSETIVIGRRAAAL